MKEYLTVRYDSLDQLNTHMNEMAADPNPWEPKLAWGAASTEWSPSIEQREVTSDHVVVYWRDKVSP